MFERHDVVLGNERASTRYRYTFDGLTPQFRLVRINRVYQFERPPEPPQYAPAPQGPWSPYSPTYAGVDAGPIPQQPEVDWAAFGQGAGQVYDQAAIYGQGMWHVSTTAEPEFVVPPPIDVQERINQLIAEGESRGQEEQE